jgi:hypothetical protein
MALLGADTDELREVGQEFQQGKETTDQVIMFLKALIAILKAASFFSGGASLAYAEYLETTVVPWLEKISQALGLFAKVLNSQAEAQDTASEGGTVDYGSLPSYQSPALPASRSPVPRPTPCRPRRRRAAPRRPQPAPPSATPRPPVRA